MTRNLDERLAVFVKAGLLERIPTRWQILQGEIEMTPYVVSTDATAESGYRDRPIAHPLVRQLVIFSHVGRDHLRTGTALGASLESLCAHLILTFHQGMPTFDLQVIQTHRDGLARLEAAIRDTRDAASHQTRDGARRDTRDAASHQTRVGARRETREAAGPQTRARPTPLARRRWRTASGLFADPVAYFDRFLGDDGWIARARRFDYAVPQTEGSAFPPEFFSLVELLRYCAAKFPAHPHEIGWARLPGHIVALAGRRFREGRGFGWFAS
jgi:hypothetical protein